MELHPLRPAVSSSPPKSATRTPVPLFAIPASNVPTTLPDARRPSPVRDSQHFQRFNRHLVAMGFISASDFGTLRPVSPSRPQPLFGLWNPVFRTRVPQIP